MINWFGYFVGAVVLWVIAILWIVFSPMIYFIGGDGKDQYTYAQYVKKCVTDTVELLSDWREQIKTDHKKGCSHEL